ncbi:MAG TPA: lysylphosphatidylglycerol synthase domain-containing protein [Pseudonocardiaceae bacterium]|nr:lysylphosphatidylglycerol synthase domain-containing protein [Pseudonocardiaceae bacterium]
MERTVLNPPRSAGRVGSLAARWLFLALALGILAWRLGGDLGGALDAAGKIGPGAVLGSFLAALAGMGASGLAWRGLLRGLGSSLSLPAAARVFFTGQIGKYIPGAVWAYIAQAKLGREHGVPASRTTAASVLFVVAHTATGAVVAGLVLPFASAEVSRRFGWIAVLAPLMLVSLHPRLVLPVLRVVHRVLGRGSPPERVSGAAVLQALGWLAVTWMGYGVSMLLLLRPVARVNTHELLPPVALGGFALAWTVGFIAAGVLVVTPAGLGVREVALLMVLGPVVAGGGAVAAVVLISRIVHTLSDGVWALLGLSLRVSTAAQRADGSQAEHLRPVPR